MVLFNYKSGSVDDGTHQSLSLKEIASKINVGDTVTGLEIREAYEILQSLDERAREVNFTLFRDTDQKITLNTFSTQ